MGTDKIINKHGGTNMTMYKKFLFFSLLTTCCCVTATDESRALRLTPEQTAKILSSLPTALATKDFKRLKVLANLGITPPAELQPQINDLLFHAAKEGTFEKVKIAVALGAHVYATDKYGNTPIMKIIHPRREDVRTAIEDRFKAAEYLIAFYGEYLDHKNNAGQTIEAFIIHTKESWIPMCKRKKTAEHAQFLCMKYDAMLSFIQKRKRFNHGIKEIVPPQYHPILNEFLQELSIAIVSDVTDFSRYLTLYTTTNLNYKALSDAEQEAMYALFTTVLCQMQVMQIIG